MSHRQEQLLWLCKCGSWSLVTRVRNSFCPSFVLVTRDGWEWTNQPETTTKKERGVLAYGCYFPLGLGNAIEMIPY